VTFRDVQRAIVAQGLSPRGAFHPDAADLPDGRRTGTLVLVGFAGSTNWSAFAAAPEAVDGTPDALDRWSRRVVGEIARDLGADALFPFDGPPWHPFQRWGRKAEPLHPSPLDMLIHPDWGLWHSWRGALAFRERLDLPQLDPRPNPCERCLEKPCLSACPVGAFASGGFDVAACTVHIGAPQGGDCMDQGCRARRACPVGAEYRYGPDQAQFHMRAFRKAQTPSAR
jgi:ferredoxin